MKRVRFLMLGGFLGGAGKTTAISRLAKHYIDQGLKVGLVTNDQAYGLVDTLSLRAQGFAVGEVTGACFCCKFDDLIGTVEQLTSDNRPDVIIAEPVGSCTDLMATVMEPLRQLYDNAYAPGPLAVLLKPEHGRKILGNDPDVGFSSKAAYIFLKQLEEAQAIVVNKIDKLSPPAREQLISLLHERFPDKEVLSVSARTGEGFDRLVDVFERVEQATPQTPEVDYDIYAEGEAELGWLNAMLHVRGAAFDLDDMVVDYVGRLQRAMALAGAEPAHLKVLGAADDATAIANLVSSNVEPELSLASGAMVESADLTVNARVAIAPEILAELIASEAAAMAESLGLQHELTDVQSFRPGRPVPTHRLRV